VWLPSERLVTVILADPPERVTGCPNWVLPSKKVTVPVGLPLVLPPDEAVTVAVKVTDWHAEAGFCELVSDRLVGTWDGFTVWVTGPEQIRPPVTSAG
jgi:hypothetical protein